MVEGPVLHPEKKKITTADNYVDLKSNKKHAKQMKNKKIKLTPNKEKSYVR